MFPRFQPRYWLAPPPTPPAWGVTVVIDIKKGASKRKNTVPGVRTARAEVGAGVLSYVVVTTYARTGCSACVIVDVSYSAFFSFGGMTGTRNGALVTKSAEDI